MHLSNKFNFGKSLSGLVMTAALLLAVVANAANKDWLGTTSIAWSTAGNWNPSGAPATGDTLLFGITSGQSVVRSTLDLGAGTFTVGTMAVNNSIANSIMQFGTLGASSYTLTNGTLTLTTDSSIRTYGATLSAGVTLNVYATLNNQTVGKGILFAAANGSVLNVQPGATSNDRFGFVASATGAAATANINATNWCTAGHWAVGSDILSVNTGSILQQNLTVNVNANQTPTANQQWIVGWTASGYENVLVVRNGATVTHGSGNILFLGGANSSTDTSAGRLQIGDATTTGAFAANSATGSITGYGGSANTSLRVGVGAGTGTMDVNNGTLTLPAAGTVVLAYGNTATSKGVINLNTNGLIDTKSSFGRASSGSGIINFNGGTLKLDSGIGAVQGSNFIESTITANVLDGGMVLDLNGKSATNYAPLLSGGTGMGGLTVKNSGTGGTFMLNATNSYKGDTTVSGGTLVLGATSSLNGGSLVVGLNAVASTNIALSGAAVNVGSGTANSLLVGYRTSSSVNAFGLVDYSALSNLTVNVGNLLVGYNNNSGGSTFAWGRLSLATNNNLTATNIIIGYSPGTTSGNTNWVMLGTGTNTVTTPSMAVGGPKENGTLILGAGGTFILNNGAGRTDVTVGNENFATSVTPPPSLADFSGGTFIGTLGALTVGLKAGAGSSGGDTGTLTLGSSPSNSVTVNTALIGSLSGATSGSPVGQGTLNIGGGNFQVVSNLTLASYSGTFGSALGALNITGGTVSVGGNIVSGAGTSSIAVSSATLVATNLVGTLAVPVSTLSLTNAVLQLSASMVTTNVAVGTLNAGGAANVIKIISAPTNNYQTAIPLISYANYNGPVNFTADLTALSNSFPRLSFAGSIITNNNRVVLNLTVHHPPAATTMTANRTAGFNLTVSLLNVATNWSDPDGNSISLTGLNRVTANGVNLTTNGNWIFYTNGPNLNDTFTYTITDGYLTTTGQVLVAVAGSVSGQTSGNITLDSNHHAVVNFAGIPNYTYAVQRSTNLVNWATIWTTNAPAGGLFQYTDSFSDLGGVPPSAAYYQLLWTH